MKTKEERYCNNGGIMIYETIEKIFFEATLDHESTISVLVLKSNHKDMRQLSRVAIKSKQFDDKIEKELLEKVRKGIYYTDYTDLYNWDLYNLNFKME